MANTPGFFITFEGIDGTGKTTQLQELRHTLEGSGRKLVVTKEPGDRVPNIDGGYSCIGSSIGYHVRQMLFKDPTTHVMAPGVNDLLFLADHVQVQQEIIIPAMEEGSIVLCDRFVDSQFAYCVGKGTPDWINEAFLKGTSVRPNIVFLLTGDPEVLVPRTKRLGTHEAGKQDGKIWADVDAQRRIQEAYVRNLSFQPGVYIVADTHQRSVNDIAKEIREHTLRILSKVRPTQQELFAEESHA